MFWFVNRTTYQDANQWLPWQFLFHSTQQIQHHSNLQQRQVMWLQPAKWEGKIMLKNKIIISTCIYRKKCKESQDKIIVNLRKCTRTNSELQNNKFYFTY